MANGETEYQGLPIRKHSIAVRGASGDALSSSLKVKPHDFKQGVPAYVLLEVMPGPIRHDPMNDGEAWELVTITKVQRGTIVDATFARPVLDEVEVALEDLRIAETGQERLALSDEIERQIDEHRRGLHKRKRKGCPMCHPVTDEDHELVADYELMGPQHGDGEGDNVHPLPSARKRRSRAAK